MTQKEKNALQKAVVDATPENPRGRWLLAPRTGKTKIGIDLIKREQPTSILWVTPSAELADFNNTEDGIVSEFSKWKAKRYVNKLTTSTWASLDKITGHFGIIILDEEQHMTENNSENLRNGSLTGDAIVSMTGTPTKHEDKIKLYESLGLKPIYDISINEAVDIGLLSNYDMKIVEVGMSNEKNIETGTKVKKWMTSEVSQYAYLTKTMQQAMFQKRRDATFRVMERLRFIKNSPSKHNVGCLAYESTSR